jgi:V8-like Glu-specific endopeptidase
VGGPPPQGIVLSAFAGGRTVTQAGMTAELAKLYRKYPTRPKQLFADWPNEDFIKTGYSSPGHNQIFPIGKRLNEPFHDRLFFAGEHTQLDHFGYMEGAIRSGERAASQIVDAVCGTQPTAPSQLRVASREHDREDVLGADDRVLVRNASAIPNRWICAIDVYDDHPAWGGGGPRYLLRGRGTGVLIGSRYLLTAAHVINRAASVGVSPGRGGDNSKHPLGRAGVKTIRRAQPFRIRRDVQQDGRTLRNVEFEIREDYALLILDRDLGTAAPAVLKGALGYWGASGSGTRIRAVPPADLTGTEVIVTGYPGDRCGTDPITGSEAERERKINDCVARRPNEWASTQWAGRGVATATANDTVLSHTVDTSSGQSGSPICLRAPDALDLVGVHTRPGPATNLGIRITDRMLTELSGWINADAGAEVSTVVNHVLHVAAKAPAAKVPA